MHLHKFDIQRVLFRQVTAKNVNLKDPDYAGEKQSNMRAERLMKVHLWLCHV